VIAGAITTDAQWCLLLQQRYHVAPFSLFLGQLSKFLEQQLKKDNVTGCCQLNEWFDESIINKWIKQIMEPYI
jgi:hypothetical protein